MEKPKNFICAAIVIVFFVPSIAYANAIIPAMQFFNKSSFFPSLVLLAVIVVIETIILKLSIKNIPFKKHLGFATVVNIVSSIAGIRIPCYPMAIQKKSFEKASFLD